MLQTEYSDEEQTQRKRRMKQKKGQGTKKLKQSKVVDGSDFFGDLL